MEKIFSGRKTPVAGPSSRKTPDPVVEERGEPEKREGAIIRRDMESRGSMQGDERDRDSDTDSEVEDLTERPSEYVRFTKNHPLGQFLLTVVADNMDLHKKIKSKSTKINIDTLCETFYRSINQNEENIDMKIRDGKAEIKQDIIDQELTSHTINREIRAPTNFSRRELSADEWNAALRQFPTRTKFSGSTNDEHKGGMSVTEYLGEMTDTQKRVNLSRDDFEMMMKKTTTGRAHAILTDYLTTGESIESIYHLFMLNFDRRLTPTEAKTQLNNFKAQKNHNLARVTTQIGQLAVRANSILPEGESRNHSYNLDCAQALMRALPSASSNLVSNTYHHLTAQRGRAATFVELTRKLDIYMDSIDSDIKKNGMEPKARGKFNNKAQGRSGSGNSPYTAYGMDQMGAKREAMGYENPQHFTYGVSANPKPNPNFNKGGNNNSRRKRFEKKYPNNGNTQRKSCSLCGQYTHKFDACPNMITDMGKRVPVVPSQDTCQRCPPSVNPRLHHNTAICPFRKGGILEGSA